MRLPPTTTGHEPRARIFLLLAAVSGDEAADRVIDPAADTREVLQAMADYARNFGIQ